MAEKISGHQKAYVCIDVFKKEKPVLLVSRADGDWVFVCGDDHPDDPSYYKVVGIGHLFEFDPSLQSILDLPSDWEAERTDVEGLWIRRKIMSDT